MSCQGLPGCQPRPGLLFTLASETACDLSSTPFSRSCSRWCPWQTAWPGRPHIQVWCPGPCHSELPPDPLLASLPEKPRGSVAAWALLAQQVHKVQRHQSTRARHTHAWHLAAAASACPCPSPGRQTAFFPLRSACSPCSFPTLAADTWFQHQVQGRPGLPCSRPWPRRLHHPWAGASGLQKQGLFLYRSNSCQVLICRLFSVMSFLFYLK